MNEVRGRHFEREIVLRAVRGWCRHRIGHRDLEQMMAERGVRVEHSTISGWVRRHAPEIEGGLRCSGSGIRRVGSRWKRFSS